MKGALKWLTAFLLVGAALGCDGGPRSDDAEGRLLELAGSVGIAWLPSGLYSIDVSNGSLNAELRRIDIESGATTVIPWPASSCPEELRDSLVGREGKLYVARTCEVIPGPPPLRDYIVFDPTTSSWSTLETGAWSIPVQGRLAWNEGAQEGLFTTPSQACSTVFRLTREGPSFIAQTIPTPLGDVNMRAGLSMQSGTAECLRDGRILGAPVNGRGEVALMVSPVSGPAGPDRLDEPSALIIARWSPGSAEPLIDFRSLISDIEDASPPAWSADGNTVYWAGDGRLRAADSTSWTVTDLAGVSAAEIAPSPEGDRLAVRRSVVTAENASRNEIRIVDLPPAT